jgi:hypothetical protein
MVVGDSTLESLTPSVNAPLTPFKFFKRIWVMPTHICLGKQSCKNSNTWGHGLTSLFDLYCWPLSFTTGKALRRGRYPNLGPH